MRNFANILFLFLGVLFSQTDTTLTIYGESNLFIGDSKNPNLSWISPNGNEIYENASSINLQWNGYDDSFTNESISIYFSQNLGYSFEAIEQNISNSQNYSFNTPDINSAFARFKITAIDYYGNQSEDLSDLYFTIGNPPTWDSNNSGGQQEITINIDSESESFEGDSKSPEILWQFPNGNEEFNQGQSITLGWNGNDDTFINESISIYYSKNLGSPFDIVDENISVNDLVSIVLPNINSAFGRFKVLAIDNYGNTNEDKSDLYFTVGNPDYQEGGETSSSLTLNIENESNNFIGDSKSPSLEWLYPNGGEQFDNYETITTLWNAEDESFGDESISIYLSKELGGYYQSYNSENLPNLPYYDIQLPYADEAFARFKVTATDTFGNSSEDFGDDYFIIGDPFGNYNVNPYDDLVILDWGWAGYHLILIEPEALSFMNSGDEIHVIDFNGIIADECNDENYGLVSVSQAPYFNNAIQPYTLYSVEGYENCDETETSQAGYVPGNEVGFLHYDVSSDNFYELSPSFVSWSGIFGDTPQDTLSFKFYDQSTNKTYTINEQIPFTPNMIQGNAVSPIDFTYNNESYEEGSFECDFNFNDYEYNGSITSSLSNIEAGDKIACFVGNQCRGTIEAADSPFNTTIFSLMTYGNPALSIIDSFEQTFNRIEESNFNYSNSNRDLYSFNIYRESQLIDEGLDDYFYIDDDLLSEGEYCYEISLSDNEGNELIISDNQCIEVTAQNQQISGDINGDLMINIVDIVMLVDMILNGNSDHLSADINQDGLVNIVDVVMLVDWIVNP